MNKFICISINNFIESLKNPDSLKYAFWLSILSLVVFSLFKYFSYKEGCKEDWGHLILELPIDICLVIVTILMTGYMKGENFSIGVIMVLSSLVVSFIGCIFRRKSIRHSYDEGKKCKMFIFAIIEIIIVVSWSFGIYMKII